MMELLKFETSPSLRVCTVHVFCVCVSVHVYARMCKACNIMSQSPEGSFTMVMPHQRRNCSFSIIYPVEMQVTDLSLGDAKSNEITPLVRHRQTGHSTNKKKQCN